jgi:thiamine-phosphate pyrophosphorylase
MTEQRRHGEPVGESADDGRLEARRDDVQRRAVGNDVRHARRLTRDGAADGRSQRNGADVIAARRGDASAHGRVDRPLPIPDRPEGEPRVHSAPVRPIPRLLLVTDRHATGGRDLIDVVAAALDAGLPAVQLREKDLPGRALLALAERLRAATARTGALLLLNDRVDVAIAAGADGVHLGGGSMSVGDVRRLLPAGALVGVSTHAAAEVAETGADYAIFGPVRATPSKVAFGPPQGIARLAAATAAAAVPVLAIGGIEPADVPAMCAAGAHGVAVIRAILAAPDPAAATRALAKGLPSTRRVGMMPACR